MTLIRLGTGFAKQVTNKDRAAWADVGVRAFQKTVKVDDHDVLGDLLCDLMHWADENNYDFEAALDRARHHYDHEVIAEMYGPQKKGPPRGKTL